VIAQVETDEGAELNDLVVAVVLAQFIEKRGVDRVGIGQHQLAVTQSDLFRRRKTSTRGMIADALVEQRL
jgi:hypothetical protein